MNVRTCIQCDSVGRWINGGQCIRSGNRNRLWCGIRCLCRRGVYVATATNIGRIRLVAYFITLFIVGVLGAGLIGTKLAAITHYEKPLDALGAVIISAMCIKFLTFLNSQDLNSLFSILSRIRGGGSNGSK